MKQKLLTDIELDVHELKYLMDSFTKEPTPTLSELLKRSITRMQGRLDELQQEVDAVQVISPSAVEETAEEEDEVAGSEEDSPVIIQSLESVVVKEDEEGEAIVAEEKPVVIAAAAETAAEEAAAKAAAAAKEKYASVSTTARSSYSASADEIHLLAAIVYWESGWEPANGQLAVANVVLNRVLSSRFSQNTIASVIYAPGQFSGVAENGAPSARFQAVLNMSNEQLNQRGCYDAAVTALSGQNNIGDLLFFINVRKANYNKYTSYTIINNHCFYIY